MSVCVLSDYMMRHYFLEYMHARTYVAFIYTKHGGPSASLTSVCLCSFRLTTVIIMVSHDRGPGPGPGPGPEASCIVLDNYEGKKIATPGLDPGILLIGIMK